jgi:hypothetical protein
MRLRNDLDRLPGASPRLSLVGTGPAARHTWEAVLPTDPTVPAFQTPAWLDAICAATSYEDATCAYRTEDGRSMVLPVVRRVLPGPLSFVGSLPVGWGTGGLVSSDGMISSEDVVGVVADIRRRAGLRITVQTLDLAGGFDDVWHERVSAAARRACATAERSNLRVEARHAGEPTSAPAGDRARVQPQAALLPHGRVPP